MEFKKKDVTIVFVSHGLGDVERICDRVALLNNGKYQKTKNFKCHSRNLLLGIHFN